MLRVVFGYLMAKPQEEIPCISIPLHTLIELTPMPNGQMSVEYIVSGLMKEGGGMQVPGQRVDSWASKLAR